MWTRTKHTLTNFEVAGVNLALYEMVGHQNTTEPSVDIEPFELYQDFDIGSRIKGDEDWWDMNHLYKKTIKTRSTSFYHDKIAIKKWLTSLVSWDRDTETVCPPLCLGAHLNGRAGGRKGSYTGTPSKRHRLCSQAIKQLSFQWCVGR